MNLLDVNVLVAAFLRDHPHHARAAAWWEAMVQREEPFVVPDLVWVGFVRVVTNRRAFDPPAPVADAFAFVSALSVHPLCVSDVPDSGRLRRFRDLCAASNVSGAAVVDAYLAAAAVDLGAAVISFDTDFARFDGVRWVRPA